MFHFETVHSWPLDCSLQFIVKIGLLFPNFESFHLFFSLVLACSSLTPSLSKAQSCLDLFTLLPQEAEQRRLIVDRLVHGTKKAGPERSVDPARLNPQESAEAEMMRKLAPALFSERFNFKSAADWASLGQAKAYSNIQNKFYIFYFQQHLFRIP